MGRMPTHAPDGLTEAIEAVPPQPHFDLLYVDGAFLSADDARVSPWANALSYGTGTFEGMRAVWHDAAEELYLLEPHAHYDRMQRSANALASLPRMSSEAIRA